ncbi:MAG: sigma factor, partial [Casimicrobiaceae bacterium]
MHEAFGDHAWRHGRAAGCDHYLRVTDGCAGSSSRRLRRATDRALYRRGRSACVHRAGEAPSVVGTCLPAQAHGRNHALADDLAQDTFILAWRNLKSFRQEARFSTWLYRIATNCWLAHARKRHEELLGDRDADVADEDPDDAA